MRMLARTASAVLVGLCLAPSSGQAQETTWWTNQEIDDWITAMESALSLADFEGDTTCVEAFSDAAGGLGSAKGWYGSRSYLRGSGGEWPLVALDLAVPEQNPNQSRIR